jgi:hypothetical protein
LSLQSQQVGKIVQFVTNFFLKLLFKLPTKVEFIMIAIKAPSAFGLSFRSVDAAYLSALSHSQGFSPVREMAHLMESLDRWVMQHLLAERLTEYPVATTYLEDVVAPHPAYIETLDAAPPISLSALAAQKRAAKRVTPSESKTIQAKPAAISAAPATGALSGSAAPVQSLSASTGGLSNPAVNPPLAIGGSPQTLRMLVLVLMVFLMFTLGFQLLSHTVQPDDAVNAETPFDYAVTGPDNAQLSSPATGVNARGS